MLNNESVVKKITKQYTIESSSSEKVFVVLSLLKKRKRKRKYWVHPILRLRRGEGEFRLFIKELRDYHKAIHCLLKDFDALVVILEPHI